jgi:hypothetical protein
MLAIGWDQVFLINKADRVVARLSALGHRYGPLLVWPRSSLRVSFEQLLNKQGACVTRGQVQARPEGPIKSSARPTSTSLKRLAKG